MLPRVSLEISGTTMLELLRYLEKRYYHTDRPARDAADHAILEWVRAQHAAETITPVVLGYRWKNLFLPAGTRLEVTSRQECFRATVEGNEILFRGQAVSPNQLVAACAGAARNAWREISLQIPGERGWKRASVLRAAAERADRLASQAVEAAAASGAPLPMKTRPVERWITEPRERRFCDRRNGREANAAEDFDDH